MPALGVSVPELVMKMLSDDPDLKTVTAGGITVGPASVDAQKLGAIVLAESGITAVERDLPLVRQRMTVRCLGQTMQLAERIASAVFRALHAKGRREVLQGSNGKTYLVHETLINGGPASSVGDEKSIWEDTLFLETLIGTQEVA